MLKPSPRPVLLYYPSAPWPSKFSDPVQAKIALHQWDSSQAESYVAMQKANPNMPTNGLTLWLKADSGVTRDKRGHVSEWTEQKGALSLSQSGSTMPTYVANAINGQPALHFDGSQWLSSTANIRIQKGLSMIAVASTTSPGSQEYSIYLGPGTRAMFQNRGIGYLSGQELYDTSVGYALSGAAPPTNTFMVEAATLDDTLKNVTFYQDGVKTGVGRINGVENLSPGITVGAMSDPSSGWQGDIAEILVYDHKLSNAEMSQAQAYLAQKYGFFSPPPTLSPAGGPTAGRKP